MGLCPELVRIFPLRITVVLEAMSEWKACRSPGGGPWHVESGLGYDV